MAFLEIVTRCFERPEMLRINQASLEAQTCDDWDQVLLVDEVGRGTTWANAQLADFEPLGEFIWVLDDDDMCARDTLVDELWEIVVNYDPDVIMMRMDHGQRGILPDDVTWCRRPVVARVGSAAAVIRRDLWRKHQAAWREGDYTADFNFIDAVFDDEPDVYWFDVIASRVQRISLGARE